MSAEPAKKDKGKKGKKADTPATQFPTEVRLTYYTFSVLNTVLVISFVGT